MIYVVGLGVAEQANLDAAAIFALKKATWIVGSKRQLEIITTIVEYQKVKQLPKLAEFKQWLDQLSQTVSVAVLASGDPLFYGIGSWLQRHFPKEKLEFFPALSSIQYVCHQLGMSLQEVTVVSLHGRPVATIRRSLKQNQTLLILTDQYSSPATLARECCDAGFMESKLIICERLGYLDQTIRSFKVTELLTKSLVFDELHITVIKVKGCGGLLPEFPGIRDDLFATDGSPGKGMITKREVRLAILSLLQPAATDVIWDVGAGCGSVAVELAYWQCRAQVYAIEQHGQRIKHIVNNRDQFGVVNNLMIVHGNASQEFNHLPIPNKIFIGGSNGQLEELLTEAWKRLSVLGILVASAVTEESKHCLVKFMKKISKQEQETAKTMQLAVSHGVSIATQLCYRPNLPVTLFKFIKH